MAVPTPYSNFSTTAALPPYCPTLPCFIPPFPAQLCSALSALLCSALPFSALYILRPAQHVTLLCPALFGSALLSLALPLHYNYSQIPLFHDPHCTFYAFTSSLAFHC